VQLTFEKFTGTAEGNTHDRCSLSQQKIPKSRLVTQFAVCNDYKMNFPEFLQSGKGPLDALS